MYQVQLTDELYKDAQRRAAEAGFSTVDAYVADAVSRDLMDDSDGKTAHLDHLFTPERLAPIDQADAEIRAGGKTYTMAEVQEHFEKKRKAWIENHTS